jgi:hypothetical protein
MIIFSAKREKVLQLIEIETEMECVFRVSFLDWLFSRKVFKIKVFLLRRVFFFLKVCLERFQDRRLLLLPGNLQLQSLLCLMEVEKFQVKCRG